MFENQSFILKMFLADLFQFDALKSKSQSPVSAEEFEQVLTHDKDSVEKSEEIVARYVLCHMRES